jgi:hypothetical protein
MASKGCWQMLCGIVCRKKIALAVEQHLLAGCSLYNFHADTDNYRFLSVAPNCLFLFNNCKGFFHRLTLTAR